MELGGKSPLIICEDADLNRAADIAVMANFFSSGQVCTNGTRVFVPKSRLADFEKAVVERVNAFALVTQWLKTQTSGHSLASRIWKSVVFH